MSTPDIGRYAAAQNRATDAAVAALMRYWRQIDHLDVLDKRKALEVFWPALIARFGEIDVELAAARFEAITGLAPVLAAPADPETANARMRWSLGPLFGGAGEAAAIDRLRLSADALMKEPGRRTMLASASKHGVRAARVPQGRETCSFCRMLASRGFSYVTEQSALAASHGGCSCTIRLEAEDVDGYDPADYLDEYELAADRAASGSAKDILAAMREIRDSN